MDSLFFFASKIIWALLAPDNFLVILVLGGVSLLLFGRVSVAKTLLSFLAGVMVVIAVLPVGKWLIYPLENRFERITVLPESVDGIIVLSGGVNAKPTALLDQVQVNEQVDRDIAFINLARTYPKAKLLYAGGSSSLTHQRYKGADAAARLLLELGFEVGKVTFERESRNTYESALLGKKLVQPLSGENWLLVTSAYHMPRSVGVFCQVGWPVTPYPVDFKTSTDPSIKVELQFSAHLQELSLAVKEWLGLIAYNIFGKTPALFPARCAL